MNCDKKMCCCTCIFQVEIKRRGSGKLNHVSYGCAGSEIELKGGESVVIQIGDFSHGMCELWESRKKVLKYNHATQ